MKKKCFDASEQKEKNEKECGILFEFRQDSGKGLFIFQLKDPEMISLARRILRGEEKERIHVGGIIVKKKAPYNSTWSFHLDPASIYFFSNAIEVCDADMKYIEKHLKEVGGDLLPGNRWCAWSSRLTREVKE